MLTFTERTSFDEDRGFVTEHYVIGVREVIKGEIAFQIGVCVAWHLPLSD